MILAALIIAAAPLPLEQDRPPNPAARYLMRRPLHYKESILNHPARSPRAYRSPA